MTVDLHCDLPAFLHQDLKRTPLDPKSRCSFPQLKAGGVKLQVMALFTETEKNSEKICEQQIQILEQLPKHYPNEATFFNGTFSEKI